MKERKKDIRSIKIENKIENTLLDMILEKSEIPTVIELSSRCQINRNTFYIHYNSIEDAFEKIEGKLISTIVDRINSHTKDELIATPELFGNEIIEVLFINEKILKFSLGISYSSTFCIKLTRKLIDSLFYKYVDELNAKYLRSSIAFLVSGFVYALYDLYRCKNITNKEEVVQRLGQIVRNGMKTFYS